MRVVGCGMHRGVAVDVNLAWNEECCGCTMELWWMYHEVMVDVLWKGLRRVVDVRGVMVGVPWHGLRCAGDVVPSYGGCTVEGIEAPVH
jgi:hypothetical protein